MAELDQLKHPTIAAAMQMMTVDQGASVENTRYEVPEGNWRLDRVEAALARLSKDELETLCIGEQEEMHAIANRRGMRAAHDFLEEYFTACMGGY